jgi:hypothetical protein
MNKKTSYRTFIQFILLIFLIYFTIKHIYFLYLKNNEHFMTGEMARKTCRKECIEEVKEQSIENENIASLKTNTWKLNHKCNRKCRRKIHGENEMEIKKYKPIFKRMMSDFMMHVFRF